MILLAILFWIVSLYIILDTHKLFKNKLLKWVISICLSASILSFSFSIHLFLGIDFLVYQILITILPSIYCIFQFRNIKIILKREADKKPTLSNWELILILLCFLIFSALFFLKSTRWGSWDAWAIWSLHAKFLVFEDQFINLFTNNISWTHPDYPLMLPSIIASIWKSLNTTSPMVPLFVSYLTTAGLPLLVLGSFLELQLKKIGLICYIIFCLGIFLHFFGSLQYADTLLSLFVLIPFVLINHIDKEKPLLLILIGFFAATSVWIKNEGFLFFIVFSVFFAFSHLKNIKYHVLFLMGALVPLLITLYFKGVYAPINDLVNESSVSTLNKVTEFDRYKTICGYFLVSVVFKNPLVFILLISALILDYKYAFTLVFKVVAVIIVAYFLVYIVTPKDLDWHLKTSIDRLFHHISPLLIYSVFIYFGKKHKIISFKKVT